MREAIEREQKKERRFVNGKLPKNVYRCDNVEEGEEVREPVLEEAGTETVRELFPGSTWGEGKGPKFKVRLPNPPKLLGREKKDNPVDKKGTVMAGGVALTRPMLWYLQELTWRPPGPSHAGTTNVELALDFEASTGVQLVPPGAVGKMTLQKKANMFAEAARRTAQLAKIT